eukprot:761522-Hanusia_phi.AAC.1
MKMEMMIEMLMEMFMDKEMIMEIKMIMATMKVKRTMMMRMQSSLSRSVLRHMSRAALELKSNLGEQAMIRPCVEMKGEIRFEKLVVVTSGREGMDSTCLLKDHAIANIFNGFAASGLQDDKLLRLLVKSTISVSSHFSLPPSLFPPPPCL